MTIHRKVLLAVLTVLILSLSSNFIISYININRITAYSEAANNELVDGAFSGTETALLDQANLFLNTILDEQRKMADVVLSNIALNVSLEVIFTDVYEDAWGTGMVLTAAKSIHNTDGSLIGVAALDIQLDALKELVLGTRVANTGYVFILDKTGTYIVHPDMGSDGFLHFKNDMDVPFADGLRRMMNGEDGFIREETDGGVMYLAFAPLTTADWSVGVVVPEAEILSSRETLALHMNDVAERAVKDLADMSGGAVWNFAAVSAVSICVILIIAVYITRQRISAGAYAAYAGAQAVLLHGRRYRSP